MNRLTMSHEVYALLTEPERVEWLYANGAEVGSRWGLLGWVYEGLLWVRIDGPPTEGAWHGRVRDHRHA